LDHLGRFPVEAELGRGAMGVVYKGFHPGLEVPVAIKVLGETYSKDPGFRRRFQREAASIAALNHPGIVRVYDFDEDGGSLFIVMEFIEGESLRSMLQRGPLPLHQALDVMQQLLSAVGSAHQQGIVHRDLKPDNVVLSSLGKAKVMDFGISKMLVDPQALTGTESIIGTPTYMSPEQVRGEAVDVRADIYALGSILYELLHGAPPFAGQLAAVLHAQVYTDPPESPRIPRPVMQVIRKAMAKDKAKRLATCEQFAGALLAADNAHAVAAAPPEPPAAADSHFPFKLRGRAPAEPETPPAASQATRVRGNCTETGCVGRTQWACSYVDTTGAECNTWWCAKHVAVVNHEAYCRRHASVVRALAITAGTIREMKHRPAVDDRSMALAALVSHDIDKEISEILRRRYSSRKDVHIVADSSLRQARDDRGVAWEKSWSAARAQGYETRITLSVSVAEPTLVEVRIGSRPIFRDVPDWIKNRLAGRAPETADRVHFRARLVHAVSEAVDRPAPLSGSVSTPAAAAKPGPSAGRDVPEVDRRLLEVLVLRAFASTTSLAGYQVAEMLQLPFAAIDPVIKKLAGEGLLDPGGISASETSNEWPVAERMAYAISHRGRATGEELSRATTRYLGPAPVGLEEYARNTTEVILPGLDAAVIREALDGLELAPGIEDAVRAAVNSRGSMFVYGSPGNGKTSLARRIPQLLRGPILVPHAVDLGSGEVMVVFDPAVHKLDADQPRDGRWRRVERPLVQVGGEFNLEMLNPIWDPETRVYQAPLQVKANGGVLLIDDFGRQQVTPKQVLDRLMVPLEQAIDHLNLLASGRKVEMPFRAMLILSTNMTPSELLDEAYLRRLAYKIRMPDPTPEIYQRIFDRERRRLGITANPQVFPQIGRLYGSMAIRGNHPRDLLERLVDVAAARGVKPELSPELVDAAWRTLFVAT
jgi:predicted Ser/Thr protein kinase/MoxR-like ATPase